MATRNLARTVLEAGRSSRSSYGRKRKRKQERRAGSNYCREAKDLTNLGVVDYTADGEEIAALEELDSAPVSRDRDWSFAQDDKLGPALRWMRSKCGQPWNDVFSELTKKFCGGGIAESHVVDTHMLGWVNFRNEVDRWSYYEFIVNDEGILTHVPENARRSWHNGYGAERRAWVKAQKWAGVRRVNVAGRHCYWTEAVNPYNSSPFTVFRYRQTVEFSPEDYTFWATLTDGVKQELTNA